MALLDTLIPSAASDVVAILDSNFNQVFQISRPVKATVRQPSKPMEHPVETGTIITDNIIFLPIEIELSMVLPAPEYRSVYAQIQQAYAQSTVFIIQTRTSTYPNMYMVDIPHEENTDMFDAIPLALKLKQVQIVAPASGTLPASSVANPVNQSTQNIGTKSTGTTFQAISTTGPQALLSGGIEAPPTISDAALNAGRGIVVTSNPLQPLSASTAATQNVLNGTPQNVTPTQIQTMYNASNNLGIQNALPPGGP